MMHWRNTDSGKLSSSNVYEKYIHAKSVNEILNKLIGFMCDYLHIHHVIQTVWFFLWRHNDLNFAFFSGNTILTCDDLSVVCQK